MSRDFDLLRKYEPVICYTEGEMFFPIAVDQYINQCSLWIRDKQGKERLLIPASELTLENLAQYDHTPPGCVLYLRFVNDPLTSAEYQQWLSRENRPIFHAPGRLARVGIVSRLLDSFFDLSLLLRGTVPQGTAASAERQYREIRTIDSRNVYYGRVLRENGYIILHYMFFYPMNDWRSTFYGVNDHESDWEQIFVYLADEPDPRPLWVAYASHDYSGDDLRRRWDDPTFHKIDNTHPVVYAGAGSHASYYLPGEYLTSVQLEAIQPVLRALQTINKFWEERLGQGFSRETQEQITAFLSIPFVDYARGDGVTVGPEQTQAWTPILFTEDMKWVHHYRGLWGLDTQDPLGGERAPAGPKYNRDGTVRLSWHNPLGWSGLHKVAPPQKAIEQLQRQITTSGHDLQKVRSEITQTSHELQAMELEVRALRETEYLEALYKSNLHDLEQREKQLNALYQREAELQETLEACELYLQKLRQGNYGDPHAHIQHMQAPETPLKEQSRIIELWAAVSSGLLVLVFAMSLFYDPGGFWIYTGIAIGVFVIIEAMLRGRLIRLLLNITITMAIITSLILVVEFFWALVFLGLVAAAWILISQNLRELNQD